MFALLSLDAVSLTLVERLLAEGKLPALEALRREGSWIPLESAAADFPASTHQTLFSIGITSLCILLALQRFQI